MKDGTGMLTTAETKYVTLAPLGRINVLVGKNGCGKTAALNSLLWEHSPRARPAFGFPGMELRLRISNGEGDGAIGIAREIDPTFEPGLDMGRGHMHIFAIAELVAWAQPSCILLFDDIETGIHCSLFGGLWQVLYDHACRKNFQIFASTHSKDCIDWLGALVDHCWLMDSRSHLDDGKPNPPEDSITLHRLERNGNRTTTVSYDEHEILQLMQGLRGDKKGIRLPEARQRQ